MRLIDADKLKENLFIKFGNQLPNGLFDEIDNAPTVEANSIIDGLNNEIDDLSENLAWYVNERNRLLEERRPQGKWIKLRDYDFKCSLCGDSFMDKYNFCPDCGAKMEVKK